MMGVQATSTQLFYDFCLDDHVPADHLLRGIERHLDLNGVRRELKPFYSNMGRPSVDPELMIRILIIGYCMGIRSERRLCEEVHLNLAYRWFCGLGSTAKFLTIRPSQRTATDASGRATSCGICSRPWSHVA